LDLGAGGGRREHGALPGSAPDVAEPNGRRQCKVNRRHHRSGPSGFVRCKKFRADRRCLTPNEIEDPEGAVGVPDTLDSRHDLLADVAALVEIHGERVEPSLGRERLRPELGSPFRHGILDAQTFDFIRRCLEASGRGRWQVDTRNVHPADLSGAGKRRSRRAENVKRLDGRQRSDLDIVGHDVALEPHGQRLGEGRVALDHESISLTPDPDDAIEPTLGGQNAGGHRRAGLEFPEIVGNLAVEVAKPIRAGEGESHHVDNGKKSSLAAQPGETRRKILVHAEREPPKKEKRFGFVAPADAFASAAASAEATSGSLPGN